MKKTIKKDFKNVIIAIVVAVFVFYLQPVLNFLGKSTINLAISLNVGVGNYMAQLTARDNPYLSIDFQLYLTLLLFIFVGTFFFSDLFSGISKAKDKISHSLKETEKLEKQLQGANLEEVKSREDVERKIRDMKSDLSKLLTRVGFLKKILFPIIFLVAISYVGLIAKYSTVSIANDRNTKFKNNMTVLSVYLSDLEIKRLKAEWTQMRTNDDFNKMSKTIDEYYQKFNIK